jgi:hypothetical protein
MAGPRPNKIRTSDLKTRILNLAQTTVYQVKLQPPEPVRNYLNERENFNYFSSGEDVELRCLRTSLPGVNLFTHDVTNDFPGMSEKIAYRKDFNNTIDFEFMVNTKYDVISMFDGWVDFIAGQNTDLVNGEIVNNNQQDYLSRAVSYRMNFPEEYKTDVFVTKFEKDSEVEFNSYYLEYTFKEAFPLSISPVEIGYSEGGILKYNVSMAYTRYVKKRLLR